MFEKIDLLFAEHALKGHDASEEDRLLLARLMLSAREGHLCLRLSKPHTLPSQLFETVLCEEEGRVYLRCNWEAEQLFLKGWQEIKQALPQIPLDEKEVEGHLATTSLHEEQKAAIKAAFLKSFTVITGGPGTGKSHTASCLLSLFSQVTHKPFAACAPTGKAAARLRTLLRGKGVVKTLQALLKEGGLPYDLVLVDEGSMIDAPLMAKLFSLVKEGSRLVLLGDHEQLPPVESGHLFADLVACDPDSTVFLHHSHRAELQEIVAYANRIREGKRVQGEPLPSQREVVAFIAEKLQLFKEHSPQSFFAALHAFRTLCPILKGPYGVETLNRKVYEEHLRQGHKTVFVPLMIRQNDEYLGVYNGDCVLLDPSSNRVFFEGGQEYPLSRLPKHELAYLLSVHKSQGSEYEEVMVLLPEGSESFGREMLYTAVTRAKRKATLFGEQERIGVMVAKRTVRDSRFTR